MRNRADNRFQDFFTDYQYLSLKNYLYNYRLRKEAVHKCLQNEDKELILEIGSGISPLVTQLGTVVYSDLSFDAIQTLKRTQKTGHYVVADSMWLPFKDQTYSHTVCSEVLEHVKDDRLAIAEIYRVLKKPAGKAIVTVPHRRCYFGYDDRFVKHYRRYELPELKAKLLSAGLEPVFVDRVLGPLEKLTMIPVVYAFAMFKKHQSRANANKMLPKWGLMKALVFVFKWLNRMWQKIVWLDARIMPQALATVILVKSVASKQKN